MTVSILRWVAIAAVSTIVAAAGFAFQDDDLAKELPRIPPTEARDASKTFQVHDGFRLVQAVTEPAVTSPVAAAFDADGRLYVVEMRGYPYADDVPPGAVRLLEDADDDGVFERSTVFLNDLNWPTSVVPYDGGVFIAAAPEIVYAKDTNGDGVADVRKVVFRGFGTQNVQALVNGLLWGPDGWIYGAGGPNGGRIENVQRPDRPAVEIRGRDFRFRPDTLEFETTSGGGQFGHSFDDWGHRFVCANSNHIRQIVLPAREMGRNPVYAPPSPVTDIAIEGGAGPVFRLSPPEPWRVVRTRQRVANPEFVKKAPPSELYAAGFFTSATGVTIYRGTAYPPEFQGNAFVGDVGGNLVHRKLIERAGPILSSKRADQGVEFLASTDNWFRPVNFVNTPSGTLIVIDMYRETIEHPASIPDPIKRHLDLTSGHNRGRLYEIVPDGFTRKPVRKLAKASVEDLVACLDDPQACNRETAQRLLIERRDDSAVGPLRQAVAARRTALGRLHALWTLDAIDRLDPATLALAFDDPEPNLREQVARLSGPRSAKNENVLNGLLKLAGDDDAAVRFQAALALGDVPGPKAADALAEIARRAPANDGWTRAAVLSGLKGRAGDLLAQLQGTPEFLASEAGRPWLNELAALIGAEPDRAVVNNFVAAFSKDGADPALTRAALTGLARGLRRAGKRLDDLLERSLADRLASVYQKAAERAADASAGDSARADAIALMELGPASLAIETLPELLDARHPSAVSLASLSVLNGLADPRVGARIVEQWASMGPAVRREAIEVLFARKERRPAILDGLKQEAIRPVDLDPERRRQLLDDPALKDRARELLSAAGPDDRTKVLDTYQAAADLAGDVGRGREVHKRVCATCHKAADQGLAVGPDLVTVAGRSPQDLIVHILDPNREVAPNYLNYNVEMTDGRVLSGMIADESATSLTLKRAESATDVLPRSQIEAIRSSGQSLMPEGLEKDMSAEQLADLIAFIKSLQ